MFCAPVRREGGGGGGVIGRELLEIVREGGGGELAVTNLFGFGRGRVYDHAQGGESQSTP